MAGAEWNVVIREVASRINAIKGALVADAQAAYIVDPITTTEISDASYNLAMIQDACANAEQMIAQGVGMTNNHPWRHALYKGQLNGIGSGHPSGSMIYTKAAQLVTDCIGLGPVMDAAAGGNILREAPIEEIVRRNKNLYHATTNPNGFFKLPVYFYRIQDDRIYHTVPVVFIDYYGYVRTDSTSKIPSGTTLFPHSAIPTYVAGALSMLLKEEEYAGQCQYYAAMFSGMLQAILQGFTTVDPLGAPAPHKGTEST